jgi:Protein of unknown function (DUF1304)
MNWIANVLVALVALLHIYFLVLEMFLWTKPLGLKTFGQSLQKAMDSPVLAANQGLYNGFLAAGLIWGLVHPRRHLHSRSRRSSWVASSSPASTGLRPSAAGSCWCRQPRRARADRAVAGVAGAPTQAQLRVPE